MAETGRLQDRLAALVRKFPSRRVLVVGDVVADQFVYGEISRVSREAPVLILRYETTQTVPGGAGNAASNIAALDGEASLVGLVGRDRPGRATLLELRSRGVDTSGSVSVPGHATPTKTRVLAGLAHSLRQQVIRVDNEPPYELTPEIARRLAERVRAAAEAADAIVISDYNYSVVCRDVLDALREVALRRQVPVLVDSRFRLLELGGFTTATPNEEELEHLAGRRLASDDDVLDAGRRLVEELDFQALLVTRGSRGMVLFERGRDPVRLDAVGGKEAIDVTGAGDTVIATYALTLAAGGTFEEAAHAANHAGGNVVMKRGTATLSREELLVSILHW